jgi:hypothetical protein
MFRMSVSQLSLLIRLLLELKRDIECSCPFIATSLSRPSSKTPMTQ